MSGEQPEAINLVWDPPGPISETFMNTPLPPQGALFLNGPLGSGKTTTMYTKAVDLAGDQRPSTRARALNAHKELVPVRKTILTSVRDTYRNLWKTTLPTWWERMPKSIGEWQGSEGDPATHHIQYQLRDNTVVDLIHNFLAIGDNRVEDVMRGLPTTIWCLNEFDLLAWEVFEYARGRSGRYPPMSEGGPTHYGILGDMNAPEFESDAYQKLFTKTASELEAIGVKLFILPGGRDPRAENVKNLVPGYYENQAKGQSDWYVQRMIDNRPGYSRAGKPVHGEFKDARHVAQTEIEPVKAPLTIGLDPHTVPSAVFLQRLPNGRRLVVDELQGEVNMGPRRFGQLLAERLHDRFAFIAPTSIRGMCDPSAAYGADKAAGEKDWIEIVAAVAGIRIDGAPTNDLHTRREALKIRLNSNIDGEPSIMISPRCATLRAGLNSGYRFRRTQRPGADEYSGEVEKNHYADLCEALEYACMSDGAELEVKERRSDEIERMRRLSAQGGPQDWDPFNR